MDFNRSYNLIFLIPFFIIIYLAIVYDPFQNRRLHDKKIDQELPAELSDCKVLTIESQNVRYKILRCKNEILQLK